MSKYMKVSQVASYLGLSKGHIYNEIKRGQFPNVKEFGKTYRIPKTDLENYECGSSLNTEENGAPIKQHQQVQSGVHAVPMIMS